MITFCRKKSLYYLWESHDINLYRSYDLHNAIYNFFWGGGILRVALQMVTHRNRDGSICRKQSLLEEYLKNDALDIKDIVGMACDMLLAGVDTVSFQ